MSHPNLNTPRGTELVYLNNPNARVKVIGPTHDGRLEVQLDAKRDSRGTLSAGGLDKWQIAA